MPLKIFKPHQSHFGIPGSIVRTFTDFAYIADMLFYELVQKIKFVCVVKIKGSSADIRSIGNVLYCNLIKILLQHQLNYSLFKASWDLRILRSIFNTLSSPAFL